MKNILLLFILLSPLFFSCSKKDDATSSPVACFTMDAAESTDSTHHFLFDQCPPAYDLCEWDFGDGSHSANPNPEHQYNHYGTYIVKLTVTNSSAQTSSVTHTITVGHYALDEVIWKKTTTYIPFPFVMGMWMSPVPFPTMIELIADTLYLQSQFPLTHIASSNTDYDVTSNPMYVYYGESYLSGNIDSTFAFDPGTIVNKQKDFAINFAPYDTAKFTLQFKIVYP